jgi:hypothetical protein
VVGDSLNAFDNRLMALCQTMFRSHGSQSEGLQLQTRDVKANSCARTGLAAAKVSLSARLSQVAEHV